MDKPLIYDPLAHTPLIEAHKQVSGCGVYKIVSYRSGECYVGSSVNLRRRALQHAQRSDHGRAKRLVEAFAVEGINNFSFDVLEQCEPLERAKRETWWINSLKPSLNTQAVADIPAPARDYSRKPVVGVTLGEGVADTNLIRRFANGKELFPEYVPRYRQPSTEAIDQAKRECLENGFSGFHYWGSDCLIDELPVHAAVEPIVVYA